MEKLQVIVTVTTFNSIMEKMVGEYGGPDAMERAMSLAKCWDAASYTVFTRIETVTK